MNKVSKLIFLTWAILGATESKSADYLDYVIAADADKYGPIATRESEVTYIKYFSKGSKPENSLALLGIEYQRNGMLFKRELRKKGNLHGIQKEWHSNKKMKVESPYNNGVMDGVFRHWSKAGELIANYEIKNGTGVRVIFNEKGRISFLEPFSDGSRNGLFIERGRSSISFLHYVNGRMTGVALSFRFSEDLKGITYFSPKGEYHGLLLRYDPNGSLSELEYYVNGSKVSKDQYISERNRDGFLPRVFHNPNQYKKYLSQEIQGVLESYRRIERVKIPLEFDEEGGPITRSGNAFILPK